MPTQFFEIDASTGLIKRALGSAAVTANGYIGTQWDQGGAASTDISCVINVEAVDVSSTNETYTFRIVGSNVADRSDGQVLAMAVLGHAGTITIETRNTAAGDQIIIQARTDKNDVAFRYIDLHLTVAGTTPSITFGAYFAREK